MEYIQFINRKNEISFLKNLQNDYFIVIMGRRRIGKTRLLKEVFPEDLFLFVWPDRSLEWIMENWSLENGLPQFRRIDDFLTYILDKGLVIFDEFQNFNKIDKSIFGSLQKLIDERKYSGKKTQLIVAGSSYSVLNQIFQNSKSALFNRKTHVIQLEHLPFIDLKKSLSIPLENLIQYWAVFEGVPYYYEIIDTNEAPVEEIKKHFFGQTSIFDREGDFILAMEFGTDSKVYKTILSVIANGKTNQNEIASYFEGKKTTVTKYLDILRKEFNIVKRLTPALSNPAKSRAGHYEIRDNFLSFWFKFIDSKKSLLEQNRYNEMQSYFEEHFNQYVGKKFEQLTLELTRNGLFGHFDIVNSQWGKIPGKKSSENQYEIDVLAWNKKEQKILLIECKWSDLNQKDCQRIFKKLESLSPIITDKISVKSTDIKILAKSFSFKISDENKEKLIDIKALEKLLLT